MRVILHGFEISEIKMSGNNVLEIINGIAKQTELFKTHKLNEKMCIRVLGYDTKDKLNEPLIGVEELHIVPDFSGGKGGFFKVVLGAVLIGLAMWNPGAMLSATKLVASGATTLQTLTMSIGVSLVLGGVLEMLSPAPTLKSQDSQGDPESSRYFPAEGNTVKIGTRIPLLYGSHRVYGHYLSFNVDTSDISISDPEDPDTNKSRYIKLTIPTFPNPGVIPQIFRGLSEIEIYNKEGYKINISPSNVTFPSRPSIMYRIPYDTPGDLQGNNAYDTMPTSVRNSLFDGTFNSGNSVYNPNLTALINISTGVPYGLYASTTFPSIIEIIIDLGEGNTQEISFIKLGLVSSSDQIFGVDITVEGKKSLTDPIWSQIVVLPTASVRGVKTVVYSTDGNPPAARYWRVRKINSANVGNYFNELEVYDLEGKVNIVPSMITFSGTVRNNANNLVDGNTNTQSFHVDSSGVGSFVKIDLGENNSRVLNQWRFYVSGGVVAIWDIEYSNDGSDWITVATNYNCGGGAGWKTKQW